MSINTLHKGDDDDDDDNGDNNNNNNWVEKLIALVGVNSKIVRFCKLSMEKWNTGLILKTKQEVMQSQPIQIRR